MPSARATEVAEILWELKRAGKVSTFTKVARRAGFSPGAGGRTMQTTMKAVRRDWPHLQWWRAIPDDGLIDEGGEHAQAVEEAGFELTSAQDSKVSMAEFDAHRMEWPEPESDEKKDEPEAVPQADKAKVKAKAKAKK